MGSACAASSVSRLAAAAVLVAIVAAPGCAARRLPAAVPAPSDWTVLSKLRPSSRLIVLTDTGRTTGSLRDVDDSGLSVTLRDGTVHIPRDQVRRVVVRERQTARKARLGFGIGAGLAIMTGIITETNPLGFLLLMVPGWGGTGALVGAIDGATDVREIVVYEAPACCGG